MDGTDDLQGFAAFADELADRARAAIASVRDKAAEDKSRGGRYDPVTAADRAAEQAMRDLIARRFPEHGVSGEEFGPVGGRSRFGWSLDPIDGTRSFVCGLPTWVTLIALLVDEKPVLGLVDVPRLGERFSGWEGHAQLVDAGGVRAIRTSGCGQLAQARLATTDPGLFADAEADAFASVRARARLTRYGHDGYAYARLAAGDIDLVVESGLQPHDYHALLPLIRGAGGSVGDWRGGDRFGGGQILAAATPALFEETLALLAPAAA